MTRFTKLNAEGNPAATDATDHSAVIDANTGLMWAAVELTDEEVDHYDAERLATDCRLLGFDDWRLPTVEELFAIGDRARVRPAIDTDAFPNAKADWYWSSSLFAGVSGLAWIVYFRSGFAFICNRDDDGAFVRAVCGPVRAASQ